MFDKSLKKINRKNLIITLGAVLVLAIAVVSIINFTKSESPEIIVNEDSIYDSECNNEIYACGIYIDGVYIGAAESEEAAKAVVSNALSLKADVLGVGDCDNRFDNDIEYISGSYTEDQALTDNELLKALSGNNVINYCDVLLDIQLNVVSRSTVSESVTIEYEVKNIYTDLLRNGVRQVQQNGSNGKSVETYEITYINGVEASREIVSVDVITESVAEIVKIGTRANGMTTASLNILAKPYDGIVTSYYGSRWGRMHNGLDIVAYGRSCKGDPCYAAASGVVTMAESHAGFGNLVVIDHGDGLETYYAHLSSFSVSVGDTVEVGQEVGKIGATGNVTGPHLHFEVHVDGEVVNPLLFVSYD